MVLKKCSGLVLGGFGGGTSSEVIEYDNHCLGDEAIPFIPGGPGGNIEVGIWISFKNITQFVYTKHGTKPNF